jgi:Flp pilus assembly pilin Flp
MIRRELGLDRRLGKVLCCQELRCRAEQTRSNRSDLLAALPTRFVADEVEDDAKLHSIVARGGRDIAEYAVMLAVVLAIVVATVQLIGKQANNVFSSVASTIQ